MGESDSVPRYVVRLISVAGEPFDDVIWCSCIRTPFLKKASYWKLKINTASLWAQQLLNELTCPTTIKLRLIIKQTNHEGEQKIEELTNILDHECTCLEAVNAVNGAKINLTDQNSEVILTLVDHILLDMSVKTSFNKRIVGKTAWEVFLEYEEKLISKYGQAFWINHKSNESDINAHVYDETFTPLINDQQMSDYILYSRNALTNLSFYFFDDFCIQPQTEETEARGHIGAHLINLANKDLFKKLNIGEYFDIARATTILKELPVKDVFGHLTKGYDSCIFNSKYMFSQPDTLSFETLYYPTVESYTSEDYTVVSGEREGSIIIPTIKFDNKSDNTQFDQRQRSMVIYVPDNTEAAKQRFVNYKNFLSSNMKQLVETQTMDCFCDWLQFGYIYNLDQYHNTDYIYTPIAICNVFYKDSNEKTTKHIARSIMVEYYRDGGPCSTCKFFDPIGACTLHYSYTTENDRCYDYTSSTGTVT